VRRRTAPRTWPALHRPPPPQPSPYPCPGSGLDAPPPFYFFDPRGRSSPERRAMAVNCPGRAAVVVRQVTVCLSSCLRSLACARRWGRSRVLARPLASPPRPEKAAAAAPPSLARCVPAPARSRLGRCEDKSVRVCYAKYESGQIVR
jgi:hypothetical protein